MALGPMFIIWLGRQDRGHCAGSLDLAVRHHLSVAPSAGRPQKLVVVSSFGASKWQQFSTVVFPSAVPTIIATLKVNIGLSLIGAIVGEFLAANAGLGYLIIYGQNIFKMSLVMTSLVILTVIAGVMYYCVNLLERYLLPWRR
jgi:NitT/TauT family transport system permease protein